MAYVFGAWKAVCDRCGFIYLNHQLAQDWQGLRVCRGCFETRHPHDFVQGKSDRQNPPWVRPEPPDIERTPDQGNDWSAL